MASQHNGVEDTPRYTIEIRRIASHCQNMTGFVFWQENILYHTFNQMLDDDSLLRDFVTAYPPTHCWAAGRKTVTPISEKSR